METPQKFYNVNYYHLGTKWFVNDKFVYIDTQERYFSKTMGKLCKGIKKIKFKLHHPTVSANDPFVICQLIFPHKYKNLVEQAFNEMDRILLDEYGEKYDEFTRCFVESIREMEYENEHPYGRYDDEDYDY